MSDANLTHDKETAVVKVSAHHDTLALLAHLTDGDFKSLNPSCKKRHVADARKALRTDLETICRTARAISLDIPGFKEKCRVPRGNNDNELIQTARAIASDAAPFSAQFIAHEMPADFLNHLNADIANMQEAISHQSSGMGDYIEAGAAIDETLNAGLVIVRKLDAIVRNRFANDPATLAEWNSASHTERSPRRKKPAASFSSTMEVGGDAPQGP